MIVSEVKIEDGRACANLINLLKTGRWDLSGTEAEQLVAVKKWVHEVALSMAKQLETPKAAPVATQPVGGFKIKSIKKVPSKKKK